MSFLRNPFSIGVAVVALVGLAFVLLGSVIYVAAYRKRDKLSWSNGVRVAIGIGGTAFSSFILILPALMSWASYLISSNALERDLQLASPVQQASLVARAVDGAMSVAMVAEVASYVLLVPCGLMMGLALTVPFFLTTPPGGES